jgi:parallel beta-helix repeat protein
MVIALFQPAKNDNSGAKSKTRLLMVTVFIAAAILVIAVVLVVVGPKASSQYPRHEPILIDGDSQFTRSNGVIGGSGSESNPFVIDGWEISRERIHGIEIRNADSHFVITNCSIHDIESDDNHLSHGVYLYNCSNATVYDVVFKNIEGDHAISLYGCDNSSVLSNSCILGGSATTGGVGIVLAFSGNIAVAGNSLKNNTDGIALHHSSNNTIENNLCEGHRGDAIYLYAESDNNTVRNNTLSNNGRGIHIATDCRNNTVTENTINHGYRGISLYESHWNRISGNTISNCSDGAVVIESGSMNLIWNCSLAGNNGATSVYDLDHIQARDDGSANHWYLSTPYGNWGNCWGDWTTPDSNGDGVVDAPYDIAGTAGARDEFPLVTPPV